MTYREHKNIGKRITHIRKHSRKIGENRDHAPGSGLWTLIPICSWLQLVPIIYIYIYIYIYFFFMHLLSSCQYREAVMDFDGLGTFK